MTRRKERPLVQDSPVGSQEAQEGGFRAEVGSEHGFLRNASSRASHDLPAVQRQRVAWHYAYNLAVEALDRTEATCFDPLAVFDAGRHRACRELGRVILSALDDAGWSVIPSSDAEHRARIAAGEELLAWLDPLYDPLDQGIVEQVPAPGLFVRIKRWIQGR